MKIDQIQKILACLQDASDHILQFYNTQNLSIDYKEDNSPVTQADFVSNKIIVEFLQAHTTSPILSEETSDRSDRIQEKCVWLVDPLDGTKEFLRGHEEFTINIALIENNIPTFGAIAVPVQKIIYYGTKGKGAYIYHMQKHTRLKIQCNKNKSLQNARLSVSRSHLDPILKNTLENHGITQYLPMGSALKYCRIAEGVCEGSIRKTPLMEWDIAAADCIMREAGGTITDFLGRSLHYNKEDPRFAGGIIASNGQIHNGLMEIAKKL